MPNVTFNVSPAQVHRIRVWPSNNPQVGAPPQPVPTSPAPYLDCNTDSNGHAVKAIPAGQYNFWFDDSPNYVYKAVAAPVTINWP